VRLRSTAPAAVLALVALLVPASTASAGGEFVDLAVGGGRVWLVGGESGVHSFDETSGRVRSAPVLPGAGSQLSVAVGGGATWVASVANGYTSGTISRIDRRTGALRVVWRSGTQAAQYVAIGAGSVWALLGTGSGTRIARFAPDGRLLHVWAIADAGRMAADGAGCWVSAFSSLVRIDPAGAVHRVVRAPNGDVATGGGAAWLPRQTSVLRVDEASGRVRTIASGRLALSGLQHDLAAGDGALWALSRPITEPGVSTLVRLDPLTGHSTGRVRFPGAAQAVVVRPGAVWVASIRAEEGGASDDATITRIDPRTLRRTLVLHVL
jgi:hypothetical protein